MSVSPSVVESPKLNTIVVPPLDASPPTPNTVDVPPLDASANTVVVPPLDSEPSYSPPATANDLVKQRPNKPPVASPMRPKQKKRSHSPADATPSAKSQVRRLLHMLLIVLHLNCWLAFLCFVCVCERTSKFSVDAAWCKIGSEAFFDVLLVMLCRVMH